MGKRPQINASIIGQFQKSVARNPGQSSLFHLNTIIDNDAGNVIYFYSDRVGYTITMKDQEYVFAGKNKKERLNRLRAKINDRSEEFRINKSVSTRMKNIYNKNPNDKDLIMGGNKIKYMLRSQLNDKDATNFIVPKLSSISACSDDMYFAINLIASKSNTPDKKAVSKRLSNYGNRTYVPVTLLPLCNDLEDKFL